MVDCIFNDLIEIHKHEFHKSKMFGIPISDIEGDSLRACICMLGGVIEEQKEASQRERDMYKLFRHR